MRIVLINGPRQSGKTTFANALHQVYRSKRFKSCVLPVNDPMKLEALREGTGDPNFGGVALFDTFEEYKDTPFPMLDGRTPREFYIDYGNKIKAERGPDAAASLWLTEAKRMSRMDYMIVPGVRFQDETDAATRLVGGSNVVLVMLARDGTSWKGDVGGYCEHDHSFTLINSHEGVLLSRLMDRLDRAFRVSDDQSV